MYIAILGRQPALCMAELEQVFGSDNVEWFSDQTATVKTDTLLISGLGGTLKAGKVITMLPSSDWQRVTAEIVRRYTAAWSGAEGKITLGISAFGFPVSPREVQKTGILLKQKLKKTGTSLRLIPNTEARLNTASSHHNRLGLSPNKVELLVVRGKSGKIIIAESTGAQNISALAARDQARPKRDVFVGMLPPKLAQIMINLAIGPLDPSQEHCAILDPFCGTGVILQEALLRGCLVFGTDLNPKMVEYTLENLSWLQKTHHTDGTMLTFRQADATEKQWVEASGVIQAVVSEVYLGQPFNAPPSPIKLVQVRDNCNHILTKFLRNIGSQIPSGLPLCLAVPAWRNKDGNFTHLPLIKQLDAHGFKQVGFKHVQTADLMYYREDQVVARELLVLEKQ